MTDRCGHLVNFQAELSREMKGNGKHYSSMLLNLFSANQLSAFQQDFADDKI